MRCVKLTRVALVVAMCMAVVVCSQGVARATANGIGDFDGNALTDLWELDAAGALSVTKSGQVVPETWEHWSTLVTWYDVLTANINGDVYDDIIGRTDTGQWWAAVSDGTTFTSHLVGAWAPITWNDVETGDVNSDGLEDVIGRTDDGNWWAGVSDGEVFVNQYMGTSKPFIEKTMRGAFAPPIPEPGALALLGFGLLLGRSRRRK